MTLPVTPKGPVTATLPSSWSCVEVYALFHHELFDFCWQETNDFCAAVDITYAIWERWQQTIGPMRADIVAVQDLLWQWACAYCWHVGRRNRTSEGR